MAAWLLLYVEEIRVHEAVADMVEGVTAMVRTAERLTTRRPASAPRSVDRIYKWAERGRLVPHGWTATAGP